MTAYLIARIKVNDPETYKQYTARTPEIIGRHGGRFLVRGGRMELKEGADPDYNRTVVVEFADFERAQAFYASSDYQDIIKLRWQAAESELLIVEGT